MSLYVITVIRHVSAESDFRSTNTYTVFPGASVDLQHLKINVDARDSNMRGDVGIDL